MRYMKTTIAPILKAALLLFLLICASACSTTATLTDAAKRGDMAVVKDMVDKGTDIDKGGKGGVTALAYAASQGHQDVAKLLIDKGADIDLALEGCPRFKQPYQAKCKKLLSEYAEEKNQSQAVRIATAESPREATRVVKSDVDELPAIKARSNRNAYAIVIGVEQYRQKLPAADFAASDARLVSQYLARVMGVPEQNIVTLINENATRSDFEKNIERWLPNNIEKDSSVFLYYSGHGAPNAKTGDAYLVPYDGDPAYIAETGYPLNRLYAALGRLQVKDIIVVIDSCFSGAGGRSVLAKGVKPLVMNINMPVIRKNVTVLTASAGDQISSAYGEKGHGLFTYFLLKGIKENHMVESDGSLKVNELFGYIKPEVERIARKQYNNEQTPQLIGAR